MSEVIAELPYLVTLDNREPQPHPLDVSNEAGKVLQLTLVKSMDDGL